MSKRNADERIENISAVLTNVENFAENLCRSLWELRDRVDSILGVKRARPGPGQPSSQAPVRGPEKFDGEIPKGELAVLKSIAQHGETTKEQITLMTGYKRSTRDAFVSRLKFKGLVESAGKLLLATRSGISALGKNFTPLPMGKELRRYWLDTLPGGEKAILEILINSYPKTVTADELSALTGYKRSSRDAFLSRLITRKLIIRGDRGSYVASYHLFPDSKKAKHG